MYKYENIFKIALLKSFKKWTHLVVALSFSIQRLVFVEQIM